MELNSTLLDKFNDKDSSAFSEIYEALYNDLYYFANKVYQDIVEVEACDVVHDLFVKIWNNNSAKFKNINALKGYCFISIKNEFKNYISHSKTVDNYKKEVDKNKDDLLITYIAETEFLSVISAAIDILPPECSKVFKLYIDGYSIKEISKMLGKAQSTIYAQKMESIKILKDKFKPDMMSMLSIVINI